MNDFHEYVFVKLFVGLIVLGRGSTAGEEVCTGCSYSCCGCIGGICCHSNQTVDDNLIVILTVVSIMLKIIFFCSKQLCNCNS